MSITLDTITHAVNPFNDIPNITFDSIDIGEYANEVEIYTNTPAVMIPTKLNAMASSMKTWLNSNIATPLEAQQNTFKNEVVVRTNEAMNAVETYINNEVKEFVNDIFIPWANNSGVILSDNANLLETNISTTLQQLMTDYTVHVQYQDAIITQALADLESNLANYTTGATDSGYSVHQTNQLVADLLMTKNISFEIGYKYNSDKLITYFKEGDFTTHHISYNEDETVASYGEELEISGEVRPFVNHQILTYDDEGLKTGIQQVKSYQFVINTDAGGSNAFRVTGHEINGDAATDLTILNNTSIPDVDNPNLTITRGTSYAMLFDGMQAGDFITIKDIAGNLYSNGVQGQFGEDESTILFKPYSSYCHDSISSLVGHGVTTTMGASYIDGSGVSAFDTPSKCEEYFDSTVSILNDFSRSYEYNLPGESYDSTLSDGMIYDVFISDDSGFIDTYAYTIDHNGKLGTGAVCAAVYDNGCSDIDISYGGKGYSDNAFTRIVDQGAGGGSICSLTIGNGTVSDITLTNPGAGYTGYWAVELPDVGGAAAHTHQITLTQDEVNTIKGNPGIADSGIAITKTTVDSGHTHDVTVIWNDFLGLFMFEMLADGTYSTGTHDHGPVSSGNNINPTIPVIITGDGTGASAYVILQTDPLSAGASIAEMVIENGGIGYTAVNIAISGTNTATATANASLSNGCITSINISTPGAGYTDTSSKTINVQLQNNAFVPASISARVGDTIRFTNTDLSGHDVEHVLGAFKSPNIPQNGVWDYLITKDTQITDTYDLIGTGMSGAGQMHVRNSEVLVDVITSTGGGCRAKGTIDASGTLINVAVEERGIDYVSGDTVRVMDISGSGEGAFGTPNIKRNLGVINVTNGGSGYLITDKIVITDPTGEVFSDGSKLFGTGALATISGVGGSGEITSVTVTNGGTGYTDIDFVILSENGSGGAFSTDMNTYVESITMTGRGTGYTIPTAIMVDPIGMWGNTKTVAGSFSSSASLNDGVGAITIINDWQDYVDGSQRVTIVDIDPNPTGFGATATAELNAQGAVSSITITNSGSAYKTPQVTIDGPVLYIGSAINNVDTDLALYGPNGNTDASPFSALNTSGTNFKNGIMIQFANPNGHTLNDSWEFKLQSWVEGTPDSLLYRTYQFDGATYNTSGIISLVDAWEEV
jgi:plastocyanin